MTTRIDEIADDIFRISTPVPPSEVPGGFTFNQFLIRDERPLLYHTGLRRMFPAVRGALEKVLPVEALRYLAFSHFESDECGALNAFLEAAPDAEALCSEVAAMVSIGDFACRPPRALRDGEEVSLGRHRVRWVDTPHLPHAWECGHLFDATTGTLFCGDLFTQGGDEHPPVTGGDILGPSEAMRAGLDYFSHTLRARDLLERLAELRPTTLACMHGASWRGDGGALLRALAEALSPSE
jgi:flavorubredoxin